MSFLKSELKNGKNKKAESSKRRNKSLKSVMKNLTEL